MNPRLLLVLLGCLCGLVISCKPKPPPTRIVEGVVFVTNQAKESIRLGSARIFILKAEDVTLNVEDAQTWVAQEMPQRTEEAKSAFDKFQYAKAEAKEARDFYRKKDSENWDKDINTNDSGNSYEDLARANRSYERLLEHQKEVRNLMERSGQAWKKMLAASLEYQAACTRCELLNKDFITHLFSKLPPPIAGAITNPDGQFKVEIPYEGKFAIACAETRNISREVSSELREMLGDNIKRTYHWYFYLPESDKDGVIKVQLGMESLLGEGSSLDVVPMPLKNFTADEADISDISGSL